jgi:hypothetical protein
MSHTAWSLGRFYVTTTKQYAGAALIEECTTVERDGLRRRGTGYAIRPPFIVHRAVTALVVGMWDDPDHHNPLPQWERMAVGAT